MSYNCCYATTFILLSPCNFSLSYSLLFLWVLFLSLVVVFQEVFMLFMMIISNPNLTSQMYFFYRNNFMIYAIPMTTVRNMNFSEIHMLLQVLKSSQPGQKRNLKVLIFGQILGCELLLIFSLLFDAVCLITQWIETKMIT